MAAEFLNNLPISEEERQNLAGLGVSTPLALLLLRKASPEAFDRHIGADRAPAIVEALERLLSEREKESLKAPSFAVGKFAARRGYPPQELKSSFDPVKREQLFQELQSLKSHERSAQRDRRISELEAELNALITRS